METQGKQWVIGFGIFLLVAGAAIWFFNRGYDKVSDEGYQYAMAIISACNRRDEASVQIIISKIEASREAGEVPEEDAETLTGIANRALDGDWEFAASAIRRLMEDQVELTHTQQAHTQPHNHTQP